MFIKTLATFETSWEALKAAVADGSIKEMLHSGDRIPVTLKTGENVIFEATYPEDDPLYAGNETNKPYFVLRDCLADEHAMNKSRTNEGGWAASDMRRYLNKTIFALLPDDLQAVIAPTKITQIIDGERVECEDKLFLISKTQAFGKGSWTEYEPDDTHLDIFKTERDRVKECGNNGTWFWWLRSPNSSYSTNFCDVNNGGGSGSYIANGSLGVAFGFCI